MFEGLQYTNTPVGADNHIGPYDGYTNTDVSTGKQMYFRWIHLIFHGKMAKKICLFSGGKSGFCP